MVTIQGKDCPQAAGMSLLQYLRDNSYDELRVAVECNGTIVPKKEYKKKVIAEGESIEIVSFVGGG